MLGNSRGVRFKLNQFNASQSCWCGRQLNDVGRGSGGCGRGLRWRFIEEHELVVVFTNVDNAVLVRIFTGHVRRESILRNILRDNNKNCKGNK